MTKIDVMIDPQELGKIRTCVNRFEDSLLGWVEFPQHTEITMSDVEVADYLAETFRDLASKMRKLKEEIDRD